MDPTTIILLFWAFFFVVGYTLAGHRDAAGSSTAATTVGEIMFIVSLLPFSPIIIPIGLLIFTGAMLIQGLAFAIDKIYDFFTKPSLPKIAKESQWQVEKREKERKFNEEIEIEVRRADTIKEERMLMAKQLNANHDLLYDRIFYRKYINLFTRTPHLLATHFAEGTATFPKNIPAGRAWGEHTSAYYSAMTNLISRWKVNKLHRDKNSYVSLLPNDLLEMITSHVKYNKNHQTYSGEEGARNVARNIDEESKFIEELNAYWACADQRP